MVQRYTHQVLCTSNEYMYSYVIVSRPHRSVGHVRRSFNRNSHPCWNHPWRHDKCVEHCATPENASPTKGLFDFCLVRHGYIMIACHVVLRLHECVTTPSRGAICLSAVCLNYGIICPHNVFDFSMFNVDVVICCSYQVDDVGYVLRRQDSIWTTTQEPNDRMPSHI